MDLQKIAELILARDKAYEEFSVRNSELSACKQSVTEELVSSGHSLDRVKAFFSDLENYSDYGRLMDS